MTQKVLVVDDDPAISEMLTLVLSTEGFASVVVDLLHELASKPGQGFTREELLQRVWGYRNASDTRLVNVHVQRLRAKIEKDPEKPQIVLTVRGVGYKTGE